MSLRSKAPESNLPCLVLAAALLAVLLTACEPAAAPTPAAGLLPNTAPSPRTLTVLAASSLTEAFTEIGHDFEAAHPGVRVGLNFAGSQSLRTQIELGAVADIFASASPEEMDALINEGLVPAETARIFLTNRLLVILPAANPARIQSLADLANPGLKLILASEEVPAGRYTRQVLQNLGALYGAEYGTKVLANVVSNEDNVRQVVTKVQLGEADAGFVYSSDAEAVPGLKSIEIPSANNVIAHYFIAPLASSPQPELAAEFIAYVLSPLGQATLLKWGFAPVQP
jgi:molybdate transport system substrate-binding protein